MIPSTYHVRKIDTKTAKSYIHTNHYSKGSHNGPSPCYGLFDNENLIGVLMFATPCSENVRASLFGPYYKDCVIELHRLHILDVTPKNTETWFIARCFQLLKTDRPQTLGIISFADPTEGHVGTIYRAANFIQDGQSSKTRFYIDDTGRLRHPRQNGKNISLDEAKKKGWTVSMRQGKNRYIYLLNKTARKLYEKHKEHINA
jgi:hypothetical protein